MGGKRALPVGELTLLMTDVGGSTRLWDQRPEVAGAVLERHEALIETSVLDHGGVLIRSKGEGDSTFSVFVDACSAARAAVELQRALRREPWPDGAAVRVRAALYTGHVQLREGDYYGASPNRCARLRAAAHPDQVVCSRSTADGLDHLPAEIVRTDLGLHRLRDVARAEHVYQLGHPELRADFPPLRSLAVRHNLPRERTRFVGRQPDVTAIRKRLETDRLVTVTGIGGCGKTRLAIAAATGLLEQFPDGVFFADLTPVSDPEVVAGAVLTDRRLVLVEASMRSGRMLGIVADVPREGLRRSEVSTRTYLWFDVADARSETVIRLSFPLPNRAEGRQVAAALPAPA